MKLLLDTHVLIWVAGGSPRLSSRTRVVIDNPSNEVFFSAASIWEIAIKAALGPADFSVDAQALRAGSLAHNYAEITVSGLHASRAAELQLAHKDPFDRVLLAQALEENMTLLTADAQLIAYGPPISKV